ncbi:MAG: hypothetical protein ACTSQZ_06005 [Candidatus Thorarchaeota archaeon]
MSQPTGKLSQVELEELKKLRFVRKALDELKRKGKDMDIAICPVCKSYRVVQLTSRDLGVFFGAFQPSYYCLECGWYGRTLTIMSNRPQKNAILEDLYETFSSLREPSDEFIDEVEP